MPKMQKALKARTSVNSEFSHALAKVLLLAVWVAVSLLACQFLVAIIMHLLLGNVLAQPVWNTIYAAITYSLSMLLIIFVPPAINKKFTSLRTKQSKQPSSAENLGLIKQPNRAKLLTEKLSREELGLKSLPTWTDLGLAPAGFFLYLILASLVATAFTIFPWFDASEKQDTGFNNLMYGGDRIVAMIALVIIAPIAEEIIFRGWLYAKAKKALKNPKAKGEDWPALIGASLIVSVLFGLMHGQWNVGVNVFAMSLVLCAMREITGTIYAGILMHMLKNAVAFYLVYILNFTN